jgi:signal peptidase I
VAEKKNEAFEWVKALAAAVVISFVVRAFIFTPVMVKGASMNATLHDEERVIVTKIGKPDRFDIVVFHANEQKDYIKRVIGLPGDRIEYKEDTLYVNGTAFEEPYLDKQKENLAGDLTRPFSLEETAVGQSTVPEGHLFVMGDNRQYSTDSRHIGTIPMEEVVGKANVVFYPLNGARWIKN